MRRGLPTLRGVSAESLSLPRFPSEESVGFINSVPRRRVTPPPNGIALMAESKQHGVGQKDAAASPPRDRAAAPGQGTPNGGLQGGRPPPTWAQRPDSAGSPLPTRPRGPVAWLRVRWLAPALGRVRLGFIFIF